MEVHLWVCKWDLNPAKERSDLSQIVHTKRALRFTCSIATYFFKLLLSFACVILAFSKASTPLQSTHPYIHIGCNSKIVELTNSQNRLKSISLSICNFPCFSAKTSGHTDSNFCKNQWHVHWDIKLEKEQAEIILRQPHHVFPNEQYWNG